MGKNVSKRFTKFKYSNIITVCIGITKNKYIGIGYR